MFVWTLKENNLCAKTYIGSPFIALPCQLKQHQLNIYHGDRVSLACSTSIQLLSTWCTTPTPASNWAAQLTKSINVNHVNLSFKQKRKSSWLVCQHLQPAKRSQLPRNKVIHSLIPKLLYFPQTEPSTIPQNRTKPMPFADIHVYISQSFIFKFVTAKQTRSGKQWCSCLCSAPKYICILQLLLAKREFSPGPTAFTI